jgi:hypothetical protein
LPTVIDLESYPNFKPKHNRKVTIVWIGSPCTAIYLSLIIPVLFNEKYSIQLKNNRTKIPLVENLEILFYRLEYARS